MSCKYAYWASAVKCGTKRNVLAVFGIHSLRFELFWDFLDELQPCDGVKKFGQMPEMKFSFFAFAALI
jgi:hypothetical protein